MSYSYSSYHLKSQQIDITASESNFSTVEFIIRDFLREYLALALACSEFSVVLSVLVNASLSLDWVTE